VVLVGLMWGDQPDVSCLILNTFTPPPRRSLKPWKHTFAYR
jgi:hypothetical protein